MSLPAPRLRPDPRASEPVHSRAWLSLLGTPGVLLAIYGLLALGLFGATWAHPFSQVIGDGPDPPVFIWYLRWVPFALSHGLNPLFTNYLDFPGGINLQCRHHDVQSRQCHHGGEHRHHRRAERLHGGSTVSSDLTVTQT